MEKTSILDFISKLTGAENNRQSDGGNAADKTDENRTNGGSDGAKAANTEKNISGEQKSFMKSYNPFTLAESDKRQITSPRAVKPPKSTIDLKNGKNLASEKKSDGSSDMVRFINRHNALAKQIKKKDED
ncbi:MAG: hypothetical protein SO373_05920 [Candidatus Borkfalkiaceae bacterium]|nr:hypothetical protein [Christensenellaceae bacterium]